MKNKEVSMSMIKISGSQPGCHLRFARVPQAIAHYSSVSQPVCRERFPGVPQKLSKKNYLGTSNVAVFSCKISKIRNEDRFCLERADFGKEIDKKEREFRRRLFF